VFHGARAHADQAGDDTVSTCTGPHSRRRSCVQLREAKLSNFMFEGSNPSWGIARMQRSGSSETTARYWRRERDSHRLPKLLFLGDFPNYLNIHTSGNTHDFFVIFAIHLHHRRANDSIAIFAGGRDSRLLL
jgi:hypothetical protein